MHSLSPHSFRADPEPHHLSAPWPLPPAQGLPPLSCVTATTLTWPPGLCLDLPPTYNVSPLLRPLGGPQLPHGPETPVTLPSSFSHLIPIAVPSLAGFQSTPNNPLPQGLCTCSSYCLAPFSSQTHRAPPPSLLSIRAECSHPSEAFLAASTSRSAGSCPPGPSERQTPVMLTPSFSASSV